MAILKQIGEGPIKLVDIRDTINANGGHATNDLTTFFQQNDVNKWAYDKPISYAMDFDITDHAKYLTSQGLDTSIIKTSNVAKTLLDRAIAGEDFYPYMPPLGGSDSPMRLGDFRGYNPSAVEPYYFTAPEHYEIQELPNTMYCWISLNNGAEFTMQDMAGFDNFGNEKHIGVLWTSGNDIYYLYNPQEGNIKDGIELAFPIYDTGTYYLLPVYTDYVDEYGNIDVSGWAELFIPVPGAFRTVVVERLVVYGYIKMEHFLDYDTLYLDQGNNVYGFSSYPKFTLEFPNGGTPSCTYRLGLWFKADTENGTFYGEWQYNDTDDVIYHGGGEASSEVQFVNFPTSISLSDVFEGWNNETVVNALEIRLMLNREEGQGYLTFDDSVNQIYNVEI